MNISSKTNNYLSLILITSLGFSQTATAFVHTEVEILQDLLVELKQESASTQTKQVKEEQKQVKPEKKFTKAQPKKVVVKSFEDLIRRCTSENERCAVPAEKRRLYDNLHPEIRPILENKYPVGEGRLDSFCRRRSFELVVGCAAVTIVGGLAGVFAVVFG